VSKPSLSLVEIRKIIKLRETGHTLYEIKTLTNKSNGTIWKYIKGVSILPKYQEIWRVKRGGSKAKSLRNWKEAKDKASKIVTDLNFKEKMLILSCLYWGEGNKAELNIINSDPAMIRVIILCLRDLGIKQEDLKVSIRIFEDIDEKTALNFWCNALGLPKGFINIFNVIPGKKIGKLPYGMCRLRVRKGGQYFKLIMSMIDLIKSGI